METSAVGPFPFLKKKTHVTKGMLFIQCYRESPSARLTSVAIHVEKTSNLACTEPKYRFCFKMLSQLGRQIPDY